MFALCAFSAELAPGVVYSSHSRVIVAHPTFYGRSCDIFYEVNTNTLSAQAVIEGGFTLVTNAGVIKIPFAFSMEEPVYGSEGRVIRSVYDFADFTAKEPEAAYRFFRSKAFMDSNILKNPDQIALYQTLVSDRNVERGVEEFLSLVKNSDFVLTNSFHAIIFATQFRRPFVAFSRDYGDSKIAELLDLFGLPERLLVTGQESVSAMVDYDKVHQRVTPFRIDSFNFLKNSLDGINL